MPASLSVQRLWLAAASTTPGSASREATASKSVLVRAMKSAAGTPLPGDVAHEEEDPLAVPEVVEEVAPHRAGRHERRRQLVALAGPAGGALRQHVGLDPPGDLQLALQAFLGRGGLLEVPDVGLEGVPHVVQRTGEPPDLVAGPGRWHRGVQVAGGHVVGARGQGHEWLSESPRQEDDDQGEKGEPAEGQPALHGAQPPDLLEQLVLGVEHGDRPARVADGPEGETVATTRHLHRLEAGLSRQHPLDDGLEPRSRASGVTSPRTRSEASIPSPSPRSEAAMRRSERDTMRASPDRPSSTSRTRRVQPAQAQVGGDDPGDRPVGAAEGDRPRHHGHLPPAHVAVRLRPAGLAASDRLHVPLLLPVAVVVGGEVGGDDVVGTTGPAVVVVDAPSPACGSNATAAPYTSGLPGTKRRSRRSSPSSSGSRVSTARARTIVRSSTAWRTSCTRPARESISLTVSLSAAREGHAAGEGVGHHDGDGVDRPHRQQGPHDEAGGEAAESSSGDGARGGHDRVCSKRPGLYPPARESAQADRPAPRPC